MEFTSFVRIIVTATMLALVSPIHAAVNNHAAVNIEDSSQRWDDAAARDNLLGLVPKWPADAIKIVFEEYLHPERHHLPTFINGVRPNYDALFINSFWGPKENPFVKYPRPAKVFVFLNDGSTSRKYFMAPIIQDVVSNEYYVFDAKQKQPMVLQDWISAKSNGFRYPVNFNICTGYGVSPKDSCAGESYEGEIYTYPQVADSSFPSPKRDPGQDWHTKVGVVSPGSIFDGSVPWNDVNKRKELLQSVVTWPTYKTIKKNFKKIRDSRYFIDESKPEFMRRISWLYPDDGCYSRIAAIIKDFFGPMNNMVNEFSRPSKILAFGNLCVNTSNRPDGTISWWYHTAPIVRDAVTNQTYVLDPSINAKKPTTVEKWIELITAKTGACAASPGSVSNFSICNGYGIDPSSRCEFSYNENFEAEIRGMLLQKPFRRLEKDRQVVLGRDPDKVLGDLPPWKK